MTKIGFLACLLLFSVFAIAQNNHNEGTQLLFKNVATKLTTADKIALYKQLGFMLSPDKKQFIMDKDGTDYPFDAQVFPTDLNRDSTEEIFIVYGNSYTSGNAGSSVTAFIKNSAGIYKMNLGFPGLAPDVLAAVSKGYPDLLIGGPGMTFPVWRWNGTAYAHYRDIKDTDYDKLKKRSLEDISKAYAATAKQ